MAAGTSGNKPRGERHRHPLALGAVLAFAIFLVEIVLMLLRHSLQVDTSDAFLDAGILAVVVSPLLYVLLLRPLRAEIANREESQSREREAAELNRVLLDSFPCLAFVIRAETREIVAANSSAQAMAITGGMTCYTSWAGRKEPCPWCRGPEVLATHEPAQAVVEVDGVTWEFHWVPYRDGLYLHYAFDISDRVADARRIADSEERYRTLVAEMSDGVFVCDEQGVLTFVNPAVARMGGREHPDQVIGRRIFDFLAPHTADRVASVFQQTIATGSAQDFVPVQIVRLDGTTTFAEVRSSPMLEAGRVVGLRGTIHDVSQRKRTESLLQARLRVYEFAVEHSLEELLQRALDEAETLTGSLTGFFHLVEADQETLSLQAWSTRTLAEFCRAEGKGRHYPVSESGVWVDCLRERRPVIHNDYASLPHRKGLPPGHAPVIRELVVPIFREEKVVAIMGVGNKASEYTEDDVATVFYLADVAWEIACHKLTQEDLRRREEESSAILRTALDGFWVTDTRGRFLEVNEAYCAMSGYSREELLTMGVSDVEAVESSRETARHMERFMESGSEHFQSQHHTKDGRTLDIDISANYLPSADGEDKFFVFLRDITERNQAAQALRQSESRFRSLVESAPIGIDLVDAGGHFLQSNPALERLLGYSEAELRRMSFAELTHQDDVDKDLALYQEMLDGKRNHYQIEKRFLRKDGGEAWGNLSVSLLPAGENEPLLAMGMIQDITEQKATEAQFRQSQKMEAVGQLAGGIAHDFNNLLTAILGYSDLILSNGSSTVDEVRPDLEEIKQAGQRAKALTQQILAFSRRQALRPTVVSLNQVLAEMEPFLRRTLGEHIDLVSLQHPALGQVEVDVHQFEQVVMNLAVNARDAMASGGRLTLETGNVDLDAEYCLTHPEVEPGSYVMLAVSDTGTGMDEATLARIFEPFFTTKAPGEGTGLGLATVYGIVKQSNGSISAYSEPGRGTTFKIYLPRVMTPSQGEDDVPISAPPSLRGSETILLVEDEVALRKLASRILSGLGYEVLGAGTAAEALQVLAEADGRLDLLLTDLVLPGGTQGKDLALQLLSTRPDLPVIYMSGYTRNAIVHAGRLDEGVNFLEKPFTPEALATMVRTVLDQA